MTMVYDSLSIILSVLVQAQFVFAQPSAPSTAHQDTFQSEALILESRAQTLYSTAIQFGRVNHLPVGFVFTDDACRVLPPIGLQHVSLDHVVKQLSTSVPQYDIKIVDHTLVFSPKSSSPAVLKLLSLTVPAYKLPQEVPDGQAQFLWMDIRSVLKPQEGTIVDILRTEKSQTWPPISFGTAGLEHVLNRIVENAGTGAWVLLPLNNLEDAADRMPFRLIGSESPIEPNCPMNRGS